VKPEQRIWHRLKRALDKTDAQHHRIELKTSEVGFPDVMYVLGNIGFIELKFGSDLKDWRPNQRRWAKQKEDAGIPCYVLVGDDDKTWLVRSKDHFDTNTIDNPLFVQGKSIDPILLRSWLVIPNDKILSFLRDELKEWPTKAGRFGPGQFIKGHEDAIWYYSDQGGIYYHKEWYNLVPRVKM
jgi:hypothetical protein